MTVLRPPGKLHARGTVTSGPGPAEGETQARLTALDSTPLGLAEAAGATVSLAWALETSEKKPGPKPPSDLVPASPSR